MASRAHKYSPNEALTYISASDIEDNDWSGDE